MVNEGERPRNIRGWAALAAERDRLVFRAPSPVAALRVTPNKPFVFGASVAEPRAVTPDKKPFVFGASAAEERVVTPETHSDKPFAFGANASGQEEPFVFGAKLEK